jgi:hypothetical protein
MRFTRTRNRFSGKVLELVDVLVFWCVEIICSDVFKISATASLARSMAPKDHGSVRRS